LLDSLFVDRALSYLYTLSLHDALPISEPCNVKFHTAAISSSSSTRRTCSAHPSAAAVSPTMAPPANDSRSNFGLVSNDWNHSRRSEEHTSELQSRFDLVCRLLLEKKKI